MEQITTGRGSAMKDHRPHYVYQFWGRDGRCLYIGVTSSPAGRISAHATKSWWRQVDHFSAEVHPDRATGQRAEALLIDQNQPRFNYYHAEAAAGCRAGARQGQQNWTKADVIDEAP